MPAARRLSTRVLLTCAAIAVATGLVSAGAGYLSVVVAGAAPIAYGVVLAAHLLPGVIAQDLLRQPFVALITHTLAALVAAAVSPQWFTAYLLALVLMGGVQEGIAALGRYRRWSWGMFTLQGTVLGVVLGMSAGLAIGMKYLEGWGVVATILITVAATVAWTLVGVAVGQALRRAGVSRTLR